MNQSTVIQLQGGKLRVISKHLLIIIWMIGFQFLLMLSLGASLTYKGCLLYSLQIILYLLLYYWAIPALFDKKTKGLGLFRILLLISLYFLIRGRLAYQGKNVIEFLYFIVSFNQFIYSSAYLIFIIGINFSLGVYERNELLNQNYIKALQAKLEAEAEKAKIESIATQMMLSPHLTFNTLNYIQQKADGGIPEIVRAVDLYSGIVKHSMVDILQTKTVLLSKEIEKVKDQIELYRLLADGRIFIEFKEEHDASIEAAMIPPSTLLTFVENVFRYGIVKDSDYPASITVKMEQGQFTFCTWNYKRINPRPGTGMGIKSVASTLRYYYPGLHNLEIEDLKEAFRLTLTIQL